MRDGFIFYRSFYDAIKDLPRDIQSEIYTAIMEYSLNGKETENLKPIARSVFTLMKPQIDANNKRFENGRKGGRPKSDNKPNVNQVITETKPSNNRNKTKVEPKDKDKDKDNDIKETSLSGGKESPLPQSIFEKPLMDCYEELSSNQIWAETVTMNKRSSGHAEFSLESFQSYLKSFFEKLQNEGEAVKSPKDAMSHFARWLDIELRKPKPDAYKQANENLLASDEVAGNEIYGKFLGFVKANAPHCFACMRMPTAKEVDALQKRQRAVGDNDLCKNAILEIEGRPILRERWDNLYLAIINQIKTIHGS